jgi:hypothetical protein
MSDIVERLRLENRAFLLGPELHALELEAADEIERLRAEIEQLKAELFIQRNSQISAVDGMLRAEQEIGHLNEIIVDTIKILRGLDLHFDDREALFRALLYCERCEGRGYLVGDSEWEPYAVQCPDCMGRRTAEMKIAMKK